MKHSKLLLATALSAAAWCTASQAQTIVYDAQYYDATSTGTTPSESNSVVYPPQPAYYGYAVRQYRDYNGNWRQESEPVAVVGTQRRYVYPDSAGAYPESTIVYPSYGVIYTTPFDSTITPRY